MWGVECPAGEEDQHGYRYAWLAASVPGQCLTYSTRSTNGQHRTETLGSVRW
jgi:hypothetical protein